LPIAGTSVVLPLLGVMLAGYLIGKLKLLPDNSSEVISRFVFLVAMPAFIFISLADVPVRQFFNWPYLAVLGGGMVLIYAFSILAARYLFKQNLTAQSLHALTAMFSSTAYIGLPLILILFGSVGLVPGIIGAVITVAVFMPLTIILAEIDNGRVNRAVVLTTVLTVIRNPLLVATTLGLLASATDISIAESAVDFFKLLGNAFVPCALFAAGLFISRCSIAGELNEISWVVAVKLLLHPLVTWWLAYHVFNLDDTLAAIVVLQAALPSGVPVFVIAQQYQCFESRSSAIIALSTALSVVTLPLLIVMLI